MFPAMMFGALLFTACSAEVSTGSDNYKGDGTPAGDAAATCKCYADVEAGTTEKMECTMLKSGFGFIHGSEDDSEYMKAVTACTAE